MNVKKTSMEDLDELIRLYYAALQESSVVTPLKEARPSTIQIVCYGKSFCPYSNKAEECMHSMENGIYIDMEDQNYMPLNEIHKKIIDESETIPIVIVNDEYIGGLDELMKKYVNL